MAVTHSGKTVQMTAVADTLADEWRINAIHVLHDGGTPGEIQINVGGASGFAIIDATTVADDVLAYDWASPQDLTDLYVAAVPADGLARIIVHLV